MPNSNRKSEFSELGCHRLAGLSYAGEASYLVVQITNLRHTSAGAEWRGGYWAAVTDVGRLRPVLWQRNAPLVAGQGISGRTARMR